MVVQKLDDRQNALASAGWHWPRRSRTISGLVTCREVSVSAPPVPILAAFRCTAMLAGSDLDPDRAWPGSIGAVGALRDDAFSTKPAGMFEHRRAIPGDVFVEHDACLGIP